MKDEDMTHKRESVKQVSTRQNFIVSSKFNHFVLPQLGFCYIPRFSYKNWTYYFQEPCLKQVKKSKNIKSRQNIDKIFFFNYE